MKISKLLSLILIALVVCGCSKKQSLADMLAFVPDSSAVVIVANPVSVFESFGCEVKDSKVVDTEKMIDALPTRFLGESARTKLGNLLSLKGLDFDKIVSFYDFNDLTPTVLLSISDTDAFIGSVLEINQNFDRTKSGKYVVLSDNSDGCIVICDKTGFVVGGHNAQEAIDEVEKICKKAETSKLAQWKTDYLCDNHTVCVISKLMSSDLNAGSYANANKDFFKSLSTLFFGNKDAINNAYLCLDAKLDAQTLSIDTKYCDNAGKAIEIGLLSNDNIDTSLTKYATADDMLLAFWAIPQNIDWKATLETFGQSMNANLREKETMDQVADLLSMTEGTVMLSAGFNMSMIESALPLHAVVAIGTKPGMAESLRDKIINMTIASSPKMRAGQMPGGDVCLVMPFYDPFSEEYSYDTPQYRCYFRIDGNTLVISTNTITDKGGCKVDTGSLKDLAFSLTFQANRKDALMSTLGVDADVSVQLAADSDNTKLSAVVKGNDNDAPFLETLFRALPF